MTCSFVSKQTTVSHIITKKFKNVWLPMHWTMAFNFKIFEKPIRHLQQNSNVSELQNY